MKQLTYLQSQTPPTDRGVIWRKLISVPFSVEQYYYSAITGQWEKIQDFETLESLTTRLNAFGTIDPGKIAFQLTHEVNGQTVKVKKGDCNTTLGEVEQGDIALDVIYTKGNGDMVIGKMICTDLANDTWEGFGTSDELNY